MTSDPIAPEHDAPANTVPPRTTPTWEMELLVSGATIFGLLQLPELIDRAYMRAINLSPLEYIGMLSPLWVYSKFAVITLILAFLAHLCLRGYWVALVGMDSVYPGGFNWDRVEPLPLSREIQQRLAPSVPTLIERADNRASRVFGIGFGIAIVMVVPVAMFVLALLLSIAMNVVLGPGHAGWVTGVVVAAIALPWAFARLADRRWGARLVPGSRAHRALTALLGLYSRLGMGRGNNALLSMFISHEGTSRAGVIALLVSLPVFAFIVFQMLFGRGVIGAGEFVGLDGADASSPDTVAASLYADSAPRGPMLAVVPRIPTRIVDSPYVELFIPFIPRHHREVMAKACPQALAQAEEPAATRARLQCLSRLVELRLDGQPLSLRLDATTDPASGQPGMLAMVPVADLPAGRHELSVLSPRVDREGKQYRIPFWK